MRGNEPQPGGQTIRADCWETVWSLIKLSLVMFCEAPAAESGCVNAAEWLNHAGVAANDLVRRRSTLQFETKHPPAAALTCCCRASEEGSVITLKFALCFTFQLCTWKSAWTKLWLYISQKQLCSNHRCEITLASCLPCFELSYIASSLTRLIMSSRWRFQNAHGINNCFLVVQSDTPAHILDVSRGFRNQRFALVVHCHKTLAKDNFS